MSIPEQHETDFDNPRQRFLWALRGIEFNGVPMAAPQQVFESWSEHLSKCGFVHVSELEKFASEGVVILGDLPFKQQIHYQPPVKGQNHPLNSAGAWIPVDQPIIHPEPATTATMTQEDKARVIQELREEGLID